MPSVAKAGPIRITLADLDSRLLRYLLAVVQEGSIRKAAQRQNVAASAISRQLSDLEGRLGMPLLERLPRGVAPTEAGLAVAAHALQQAEEGEQLVDYLKQLHGLRQGAVRIACGEGFLGDLVENGLQPFLADSPEVRLQLSLGGTEEILTSVAEGRADIGLVYHAQTKPGLRSVAVSRQPLCAVMAPDHPLAAAASGSLAAFASYPAALLTPSHGIRQLIGRVEADAGFHLMVSAEAGSIDIVRRLAVHCGLVTFLPRFAATTEIDRGSLRAVELTDKLLTQARAHLVVRARRRLPVVVDRAAARLIAGMRAFRPATG